MFKNIFSFKPARLVMMAGGETPERQDNVPPPGQEDMVFGDQILQARTADQKAREAAAAAFRQANKVHPEEIKGAKARAAVEAQNVMAASHRATESLRGKKESPKAAEKRARIEEARASIAQMVEYKDFSSKNVRRVMYKAADEMLSKLGDQSALGQVLKYKNLEEGNKIDEQMKITNAGRAANIALGAANRAIG